MPTKSASKPCLRSDASDRQSALAECVEYALGQEPVRAVAARDLLSWLEAPQALRTEVSRRCSPGAG